MDLVVIAQIITGTATLIVALVLVYQLRQIDHETVEIIILRDSYFSGYQIWD